MGQEVGSVGSEDPTLWYESDLRAIAVQVENWNEGGEILSRVTERLASVGSDETSLGDRLCIIPSVEKSSDY